VVELKSEEEIAHMAAAGRIIASLFAEMGGATGAGTEPWVRPGVSTLDLDTWAEAFIRSHEGALPLFKGQYGFPGSLCTSINDEVVHGVPGDARVLQDGDILSVDVGVRYQGWCADSARTFAIGEVSAEASRLMQVTKDALDAALAAAVPGGHVGDLGAAVQRTVRGTGYHIIRELVGHGIGRELHESPQIPNLGERGTGLRLRPGMVIAIEPMIAVGTWRIRTLEDGWTISTQDGSLSAHFEHTVAVQESGPPRILTAP
jgi:methionyl aminopeptidase